MEVKETNINSYLKELKTASNLTGPSEVDKLPEPVIIPYDSTKTDNSNPVDPAPIALVKSIADEYLKMKVAEIPVKMSEEQKNNVVTAIQDAYEDVSKDELLPDLVTVVEGNQTDVDPHIVKHIEENSEIQSAIVNTKDFLNILNAAAKVLPVMKSSPIYTIRLETFGGRQDKSKNKLKIQTTNLEVYFISSLDIDEDDATFDIMLDPKKIVDIVKSMTTPEICLKTQSSRSMLTVVGQFSMEMPYMDTLDNYPNLPFEEKKEDKKTVSELNNANIKTVDFLKAVEQIEYARSGDAVKQTYQKLYIESEHGEARLACTDGKRLGVAKVACEINSMPNSEPFLKRFKNLLVPECVTDSIKALKTKAEFVAFSFIKRYSLPVTEKPESHYEIAKYVTLMLGNKLTGDTRYIFANEGVFPNIDAVIPKEDAAKVKFYANKEIFTKAIAGLKPIWKDTDSVTLTCRTDSISLSARNATTAEAAIIITEKLNDIATTQSDYAFLVTLNPRYLSELVSRFDKKDAILFEIGGASSPIVVSLKDCKGTVHILMPIRLGYTGK